MYSIQSLQEFGHCSNFINAIDGVSSSVEMTNYVGNSFLNAISAAEAKAAAACKSHSEAERRRRKRINGHLATLRSLLPNTIKTDKASLLAEVVRRIRELKKKTTEIAETFNQECVPSSSSSSSSRQQNQAKLQKEYMLPSETDELKLIHCDVGGGGDSHTTMKVTLCCEDRPELMSELTRALNSVQAKVVRAEIATVGGRTKSVLWVRPQGQVPVGGEEALGSVRRALTVVVDKAALSSGLGHPMPGSNHNHKRPRLSQH